MFLRGHRIILWIWGTAYDDGSAEQGLKPVRNDRNVIAAMHAILMRAQR